MTSGCNDGVGWGRGWDTHIPIHNTLRRGTEGANTPTGLGDVTLHPC